MELVVAAQVYHMYNIADIIINYKANLKGQEIRILLNVEVGGSNLTL